ncbi:MAG: 4-hydroxybenzoate polyprenyltransferase [Myxococcota bacterium]|jgi:4-hydroxybenzoate polyprenyltransferase
MIADIASILRLHIIGVAVMATLVFGWLLTGEYPIAIALLGGVDWMLINLLNKITDVEEDRINGIAGTERVASNQRGFTIAWVVIAVGSFGFSLWRYPELTGWRVIVQLIGLAYSISLVPTLKGLRRFKDLYFFKNFMSSVLFVLTCFVYPLVVGTLIHPGGMLTVVLLVAFFVPFELTYEILYDLRDLEGDRAEGVPTYPVVHGPATSIRIINGLLLCASAALVAGLCVGAIGLLEGLMLVAPIIQFVFYRPRYQRGLTARDCIVLTHLGSVLLLVYIAGTQAWLGLDLPANIYLV